MQPFRLLRFRNRIELELLLSLFVNRLRTVLAVKDLFNMPAPSLSCSVPRCIIGARSPRGQEDSRVILTDAAITNALNQTVQKIREGDLEQAQADLAVLELHRLIRPMRDSINGPREFF